MGQKETAEVGVRQNTPELTTPEAQSIYEALYESQEHVVSFYMMMYAEFALAIGVLCLVLNFRSGMFVFLIIHAVILINTPYYVTKMSQLFQFLIIVVSTVGLLMRLLALGKNSKKIAAAKISSTSTETGR
jgi:hypothetical protein